MAEMPNAAAVNRALAEELARDERVGVLGEDVRAGMFGTTSGLVQRFGEERVINTPIWENGIAGMALGLAITGMRPVAEIMFADFMYLAMDEIANQIASWTYMTGGQTSVPLVIRTAGGAGFAIGYNHSQVTEASFLGPPGLKVVAPSNAADACGLLKSAVRDDDPVLVFEHKFLYFVPQEVPDEEFLVPLGKANVLRSGDDVTMVAIGSMVGKALEAAGTLAADGISVEVIDPRTLVPLDQETIFGSVARTGRLVTVEEGRKRGSVGSEIAAEAAEKIFGSLKAPVARVAAPDIPVPPGPRAESMYVPSAERIVETVRRLVG
ncbi:MAG: alpha-ketoacid dehydrogenase subunit beta [Gemmatimonadetes bacterium]|nr:alpha-ketoacid dehydrogenase subunit beta [Gemmatimonadota bacterium]